MQRTSTLQPPLAAQAAAGHTTSVWQAHGVLLWLVALSEAATRHQLSPHLSLLLCCAWCVPCVARSYFVPSVRTYLPGTSVSSVRPCHNTRKFWKFCKTFIPVPGTSVSSVGHSYPYPELLWVLYHIHTRTRNFREFCTPRTTITGLRVHCFLYAPGTFVRSVRPCHNSRSFC